MLQINPVLLSTKITHIDKAKNSLKLLSIYNTNKGKCGNFELMSGIDKGKWTNHLLIDVREV